MNQMTAAEFMPLPTMETMLARNISFSPREWEEKVTISLFQHDFFMPQHVRRILMERFVICRWEVR